MKFFDPTWSETEQEVYIKRLFDSQNEEAKDALLSKAEQREQEAQEEGRKKGEKQKAREIAKEMRVMGIDTKIIAQVTKMTKEEIDLLP